MYPVLFYDPEIFYLCNKSHTGTSLLMACSSFQAKYCSDLPSETVSKIHLVDLAGR